MINIERVITGFLEENCYIVWKDNNREAILIDPGDNFSKIKERVEKLNLEIKAVLLTHGHFDHFGAARKFQLEGIPVYIHENDQDKLFSKKCLSFDIRDDKKVIADHLFSSDFSSIEIANMKIDVVLTKGHSKGSVCYVIENNIFSGDTLFRESYGRTDFFDGDDKEMIHSLKEILFKMDDDFIVFPGHGEKTTIGYERLNNYINYTC